jgi:hypothetical protein
MPQISLSNCNTSPVRDWRELLTDIFRISRIEKHCTIGDGSFEIDDLILQTEQGERSCWLLTGYVLPIIPRLTGLTVRSDDADYFWDRFEKPDLLGQSLTLYVSQTTAVLAFY